MSLGVVVVVYFLVAAAELPDKTMIATVVMGSRNPPALVWAGAAGGFLLQAAIAVAAGRLVELLPHETLEIVVTVLFFVGAVVLLFGTKLRERRERREGEPEAARAVQGAPTAGRTGPGRRRLPRLRGAAHGATTPRLDARVPEGDNVGTEAANRVPAAVVPWKVVTTAFAVIAIGEFGDLTQLLMVNLVGKYHEPWAVFVGGFAGLVSMSAVAAFGGRALLRWIPLEWVRIAGGLALLGFAAYGIYALAA
ncbi:MAG: TMEM165/GDT1 family protein [Acidimicrobiales bacterium]